VSRSAIQVTVVYAPQARVVHEIALSLPSPCTVCEAIAQGGLAQRFPELNDPTLTFGVWGRKVAAHQALRDRDRVEIYRALRVDPKVARRERFVKQGARTAGLFAKKRAGARAGY